MVHVNDSRRFLVDVSEELASNVFATSLLVVHDTGGGGLGESKVVNLTK
jgi:hypothetical protein